MRASNFTARPWMTAAELNGQAVQLQISSVSAESFEGDQKLALHFNSQNQGMVLNKTNTNTIIEAYGDETDNWIGKIVEIFPTRVDFAGKQVDALRIRIPAAPAAPVQPAVPPVAPVTPPAAAGEVPVDFDEGQPIPF